MVEHPGLSLGPDHHPTSSIRETLEHTYSRCPLTVAYPAVDAIEALDLPPSRWVDVGGPVHYREWEGPASGPTFICVHGLGGSHLNWAGVAPMLARRGRVLALDLAGFGLTPPRDRGTSVGANWRLLQGFVSSLAPSPVVLVGNSMGGMLSLIQAAHSPETVRSLVLVDAAFPRARAVRGQPSPRVAAVFALYNGGKVAERFVEERVRRLGPEGLVRETFRVCAADPSSIDPILREAHVEMARQRMDFEYAAQAFLSAARSIFRSQVFPSKYRALVQSVGVPALVLHGARDQLIPQASAREAAAGHPDWKLVVFEDLGHIPQMEAPQRWLAEVTGWLDQGEPGRAIGLGATESG
jgi:pimeloyl-ACP methyl ester carboxylesterase